MKWDYSYGRDAIAPVRINLTPGNARGGRVIRRGEGGDGRLGGPLWSPASAYWRTAQSHRRGTEGKTAGDHKGPSPPSASLAPRMVMGLSLGSCPLSVIYHARTNGLH